MYGKENPEFKKTVDAILKEINGKAKGVYDLNPKVYHDNEPDKLYGELFELEPEEFRMALQDIAYKNPDNLLNIIDDERLDPKNFDFSLIAIISRRGVSDKAIEVIKKLIDKGEDVNKLYGVRSGFVNAIDYNSIELIELLLENGYKIEQSDRNAILRMLYSLHVKIKRDCLKKILKYIDAKEIAADSQSYRNKFYSNVSFLDAIYMSYDNYGYRNEIIEMLCKTKSQFNNFTPRQVKNKFKNHPEILEIFSKYNKI